MWSIKNLVHELPQQLLNDLKPRILGNKDILAKSKNVWGHSLESSLPYRNKHWSPKKCAKTDIIFPVLSNFVWFLKFPENVLRRIIASLITGIPHLIIMRTRWHSNIMIWNSFLSNRKADWNTKKSCNVKSSSIKAWLRVWLF